MKILKIKFDASKGEYYNGKRIVFAQRLPNVERKEYNCIEGYGIVADVCDTSKNFALKRFSVFNNNIVGIPEEITKAEARKLLIAKIDKSLDILFDPKEMERVDRELNVNMNHLID